MILEIFLFATFFFIVLPAVYPNPFVNVEEAKKIIATAFPSKKVKFVRLPDGRLLEYFVCGAGTFEKVIIANHPYGYSGGVFALSPFVELYKKLGV